MDAVWDSIDWNWHHHPVSDEAVIENATALLLAARSADILPESAAAGYFRSVRLLWRSGTIEVEVFQDCFELYFLPGADEKTSYTIHEFDAESPNALAKLVARISETLRTL